MAEVSAWRNRIVGHGEEAPADLVTNPRNFRIHPKTQRDAMTGVLGALGWIDEIIVNRRSGCVINGHMRVAVAIGHDEPSVPVKYVELDDDEEALALATFDPLGALAATNAAQLSALLATVTPSDDALRAMLDGLDASVTPTIPTASEQSEPVLRSECLIEIRCTTADRDDFAAVLDDWGARDGVEIDIS